MMVMKVEMAMKVIYMKVGAEVVDGGILNRSFVSTSGYVAMRRPVHQIHYRHPLHLECVSFLVTVVVMMMMMRMMTSVRLGYH